MPQLLTVAELLQARNLIDQGKVIDFYKYMSDQGYGYANTGRGVIECTLLSGGSTAQVYMSQSALTQGASLTSTQVAQIEINMAKGYINTLIKNAENNGGAYSFDVTYKEALTFHNKVFEEQNLSHETWTLFAPSKFLSDAKLEANWQLAITSNTASAIGSFLRGFTLDMGIAKTQALISGDLETLNQIQAWQIKVESAAVLGIAAARGALDMAVGCLQNPQDSIDAVIASAQARLNTDPVQTPSNFDTPSRNSADYITDNGASSHSAILNAGGTISDLVLLQNRAGNNITVADILTSNPSITNVNSIPTGTTIYIPKKQSDGSITYHYAGGASVNSNATTGEYHMIVPDGNGGTTIYSRTADDFGYTVKEVRVNAAGDEIYKFQGTQPTLSSAVTSIGIYNATSISGEVSRVTYDDGSSLEATTTPDGKVVSKSYDTDGLLAGTITDTPDGLGGMDREINTVVNGKAVIINQYATQEALDNDLDGDGLGGNDARDYKTRSIKIGGQQAVNDDAVAGAWDAANDVNWWLAA